MYDKPTILVQLDTDPQPSAFDRVVAVDSGVDHLFSYGGVTLPAVMGLVHGCIFTRGPKDLHRTAVFIGGSDVTAGEAVLAEVRKHLIPQYGLNVSVMLDSNGANTTAAAAVRAAGRHLDLGQSQSLVLGGTGPVGQRVARLLAREGAEVRIGLACNVQDGAVIHVGSGRGTRIGDYCSIAHRAVVHGAEVEDDCLIGMGARVLNGAFLGPECLVGANALITEGKRFEAGGLIVGAPARVIRQLTDQEKASLRLSAAHYAEKAARYASALKAHR